MLVSVRTGKYQHHICTTTTATATTTITTTTTTTTTTTITTTTTTTTTTRDHSMLGPVPYTMQRYLREERRGARIFTGRMPVLSVRVFFNNVKALAESAH